MIALAVVWLALTVRLGLDLAGHARARRGYRWMLLSLLITGEGALALEIANDRNWPFAQRHVVARIVLLLAVASVALLVTGMAIKARSRSAD
jgi:hypothetical protein